jgi:hypothetical protein
VGSALGPQPPWAFHAIANSVLTLSYGFSITFALYTEMLFPLDELHALTIPFHHNTSPGEPSMKRSLSNAVRLPSPSSLQLFTLIVLLFSLRLSGAIENPCGLIVSSHSNDPLVSDNK